jgi:hypothetical protein
MSYVLALFLTLNILTALEVYASIEALPVTPNDPVINALPVKGNEGVEGAYEALKAVVAYDAVKAYEALVTVPAK